jgi:hypothetical protein
MGKSCQAEPGVRNAEVLGIVCENFGGDINELTLAC